MKNNRTIKPVKNFQKKKYYTKQNIKIKNPKKNNELKVEYYFDPQTKEWHQRIITDNLK